MRGFAGVFQRGATGPAAWRVRPGSELAAADWSGGRLWFNGRIDNHTEVTRRHGAPPDTSAAAAAALAIERLGMAAGLADLIGDFVVVAHLHDGTGVLATDAIGYRDVFYADRGAEVEISTRLADVSVRAGRINEGFLSEYLSSVISTPAETPYDGVHRLPPATIVRFRPDSPMRDAEVYWQPPQTPFAGSDASAPALVEEFARLLREAVRAAAGTGPVAVQLSGGVDSSTVTALLVEGGAAPDSYSLVYPGFRCDADHELVDESPEIDAFLQGCAVAMSRRVDPRPRRAEDFLRVSLVHGDVPDWPVADALMLPLYQAARADGHTVMLTGLGGDAWLTGSLARLPELLRRGHWREAAGFVHAAQTSAELSASPLALAARVSSALLPAWSKPMLRRLAPRARPAWLRPEWVARTGLADRERQWYLGVPAPSDRVMRDSLLRFAAPELLLARRSAARTAGDCGLDARHPFFDRRVVDFVLRLPDELRFSGGRTRHILREAMRDVLPEATRTRTSKGDAHWLVGAAVHALAGGRAPRHWRLADLGWIEPAPLDAAVAAILADDPMRRVPRADDYDVWHAVALDAWLRQR